MIRHLGGFLALCILAASSFAVDTTLAVVPPGVEDQVQAASTKISPALEVAERLTIEGKFDEANAHILATIPNDSGTSIEKFVLGNVLFKALPKTSYALHKEAAAALPSSPDVLFEWALEQHRAKEYVGAAQTYEAFSKLRPNHAPAYGLAAECAIRLGHPDQAVALWQSSESAPSGTLEQLESLICDVNGGINNEPARKRLMRLAEKGEAKAAEDLLLLDADWRIDWWNAGPDLERLEHDLALLKKTFPQPTPGLQAALCVADCTLETQQEGIGDLKTRLAGAGFLLDNKGTLPDNGKALSLLLALALAHTPMTEKEAQDKFGERVLAMARKSKDTEMFNAAAYLYLSSPRLEEIDQEAWDTTHDARFAVSRIVGLAGQNKLTLADPLLQRALKEYPENSEILHVAVVLALADKNALPRYLIEGIKAEYTKFSVTRPGIDFPRPSAYVLRGYFDLLAHTQTK